MDTQSSPLVLVTGGTGFVAIHCILQLLQQGYRVRTTIRTMDRKDEIFSMLRNGGLEVVENLSFIEANLIEDKNWKQAVDGCDYVLHVASPIGLEQPKDQNEMIIPAVEGTLRVLKNARDAKVKRVVLTSSFGATSFGYPKGERIFTEEDWTNLEDKNLAPYIKSKTLAEKVAWDFVKNEGEGLELSVINPTGIFGPTLSHRLSSGFEILKKMLDGSIKACPKISFCVVDVRDVADLHIRTMTHAEAAGERFIASSSDAPISIREIAETLREMLKEKASKVPTKELPNFIIYALALFSPLVKNVAQQLGRVRFANNQKAMKVLGWKPRSCREAIVASIESIKPFL